MLFHGSMRNTNRCDSNLEHNAAGDYWQTGAKVQSPRRRRRRLSPLPFLETLFAIFQQRRVVLEVEIETVFSRGIELAIVV